MNKRFRKIAFVVPPGAHLLDFAGPAHIFYEAQDYGAEIESLFINLDYETLATTSAGLKVSELHNFKDIELIEGDLIFIPGLDASILLQPDFTDKISEFLNWLKEQHSNGITICSVCTGAYIPAFAGILDNHNATTHWKYLDRFEKSFPKVNVIKNRLFVESNNIYSSAGVASGIDLALFILEQLYDSYFTAKVAREVVIYLRRGEEDPQLSVFLQYRNHMEDKVHFIQDWLTQNLDKKSSVDELAEMVHSSPRNLTRLFKKATGTTIGKYLDQLRVAHAIHLLESGDKVEAVTNQCGLNSPNQLREILKKYTGKLPSQLS